MATCGFPSAVAVNPVTLEIVRNAVYSAAEEMSAVLVHAARSPVLKEAGDLSCVLTDGRGRLIAQGRDIPIHLGVMAFTVKEFLKWVPAENLRDGDVYFLNRTDIGGNHLPDVKAIQPVFWGGEIVAFAVALAHWPDVGGALPGSYVPWAREIWQEGLQLPPFRLFTAEGPVAENLEVVLSNVRGREERLGDILAQRAACAVGARRVKELYDAHGATEMNACLERMLDESEEQLRARIREVPDGVYHGEDHLDDDGVEDRPVRIAVAVEVKGDEILFDFTGTDPQVQGPVNTTYFVTCSAVYYTCKALLGPDIPANDGAYRCVRVLVPERTVLNPAPGAAVVGGNHETSQRVVDACFRALAQAIPERITAGGMGSSGLALITGRDAGGRPFFLYEVHAGGEGASSWRDGANAVRVHMSNVMNTPIEALEAEYPLRVEECSLREGSGGAGRHRGGLGLRRSYRLLADEARLTTMVERCRIAPWGALGGRDGAVARVTLNPGPAARPVRGKETLTLRRGDLVLVETAGGGGFGPPAERSPQAAARDRALGYVFDPADEEA